jgi:hypothetical protein
VDQSDSNPAREEGIISLFRAVGIKELEQIRATNRFESSLASMSGKWFAETAEHAARWGDLLEGPGKYSVVEAAMSAKIADTLFRIARLDGIGPARYVGADQLGELRVISEVGK